MFILDNLDKCSAMITKHWLYRLGVLRTKPAVQKSNTYKRVLIINYKHT